MIDQKYILIKDIERCPFVANTINYDKWMKDDNDRLNQIINERKDLYIKAQQYLSHEDRNVRNLALFYNYIFGAP